jgi:hypothetical protein
MSEAKVNFQYYVDIHINGVCIFQEDYIHYSRPDPIREDPAEMFHY